MNETTYRIGNVNITAANVGALPINAKVLNVSKTTAQWAATPRLTRIQKSH